MEEKRYPLFEEEKGVGMVSEPVAAPVADYMPVDAVTADHDWIDNLDWDKFPSFGPFSDEEAIARIDDFEERLAKGRVEWVTSEEVTKHLLEKFPWLQ